MDSFTGAGQWFVDAEAYPPRGGTVSMWVGNSAAVPAKHYLQVTNADYERAITPPAATVRKPVPSGAAGTGTESQQQSRSREISGKNEEVRLCASTPIGR